MILANAHPKAGCNLLKKTLGGLGLEHVDGGLVRHMPDGKLWVSKNTPFKPDAAFAMDDTKFIHGHVCYGSLPECRLVTSVRNPRNAAVSFLRWAEARQSNLTPFRVSSADLLKLIRSGAYDLGPWAEGFYNFAKWVLEPWVCVVRFEDICSDGGKSVERIARYVDADPLRASEVYDGLYGNGAKIDGRPVYKGKSTWTGEWSDWRTFWTEEIDQAWSDTGGVQLERFLGYYDM